MNLLLRMLVLETIHQMQFRTDGPFRSGKCFLDRANDRTSRSGNICQIVDFLRALRVHQNLDVGNPLAKLVDMRRSKHLMNAAVALPQDHAAVGKCALADAALVLPGVPDRHLFVGDAHLQRRVAAQVLVGQEEDLRGLALTERPITAGQRPPEHLVAIGAVQTAPPCSPQKALIAAVEFM